MSKKITGIIVSFLMAVAMLAGIPQLSALVRADEGDQAALVMGSDVLATDVNTDNAQMVWYAGKTWRVISYGDSGNKYAKQSGVATLFSSGLLASNQQFNPDKTAANANDYKDSLLQTKIDGLFTELFSTAEQKAVVERTLGVEEYKSSEPYSNGVSGTATKGYLWPLSTAEAYALPSNAFRSTGSTGGYWWLRSPGNNDYHVAEVFLDGYVYYDGYDVTCNDSVRPAFYLNLKSVLFTSAAASGKSSGTIGANALAEVKSYKISDINADGWKFTLKDDGTITGLNGHEKFKVTTSAVTYDSATKVVTVPYTGATTGTNEYISAIITDSTGKTIKYYGRIAQPSNADGSVTISTSDKLGDDDKLFVFNEQKNDNTVTDFASALFEIKIRKDVTLTLSASNIAYGANETFTAAGLPSDATGTVRFAYKASGDTSEKAAEVSVSNGQTELTLTKPDADSYTVTATYSGDDNYNTASTSTTFTVSQAIPDLMAPLGLTAICGQTLADVALPAEAGGVWTWQDAATTSVGDAGSNTFKATFTPTDTKNYATLTDVEVTITVLEKKAYSFTSGAGGKWTSGSTDALEFVVKANRDDSDTFIHFTGILVDGQKVPDNGFTKKSGSVVIDLQPDYLKTLSAGEHKLAVSFDDADAIDTTFTIEAAQEETKPADTSPKTGDSNYMVLWVVLMAAALAGGISILAMIRKRRQQ